MPEKLTRTKVFVSYSHQDSKWLERLRVHLRPLERDYNMDFWDDTQISAGANWKGEINNAIATCKIAVLLISADFLASEFIACNELPPLLKAAESEGAVILPVIVSPSRFSRSNLSQFQAVNDPDRSLEELVPVKREKVFDQIAQKIEEILGNLVEPIFEPEERQFAEAFSGRNDEVSADNESDIELLAEFRRDENGKIKRIHRSYGIRLFVRNFPTDAEKVVYKLHETYPVPTRTVENAINEFEIHLTSFGDYIYKVKIFGDRRVITKEEWLTRALRNFYGANADDEVKSAIEYLKVH